MKIDTINVIETAGAELLGITSFSDTINGRAAAVEHFSKCIKENCDEGYHGDHFDDYVSGHITTDLEGMWSDDDGEMDIILKKSN